MIRVKIKTMLLVAVLITLAAVVIPAGIGIAIAAENNVKPVIYQTPPGVAASGELFLLARCIEIALEKNPEIAAAKWDIAAADSRLDGAKSAFWPQISAEGGANRYVDPQRLIQARYNGELGVFDRSILRGDLVARLTLYAGGRITSEADAVGKLSEAEKKKFIRTRDELIYSVTGVYFSVLGQQKIIASLEFSRQALEEQRKRVSQLFDAQRVAKVDLLRTEVRIVDLNQNIIKEENVLAVQKRLLFSLMGYEAVPENVRLDDQAEKPAAGTFDKGMLIEGALKNRPDYQAAKDRLDAQTLRVAVARAGHLPSINLVGTYGVRNAPDPSDVGKGTSQTEDVGSIGVIMSVPLFEGGRVSAKVSEEMAILAAARDRLRKLDLQIRQEAESALLDVLSARERFKATEKSIEQAKESLRIESLKYDLGRGNITDVLDAQSALLQAETNNCRSCIDYHISTARLKLATGGSL
ncbi:MAG: TolC family protein [Deltaproteobacteria bacterium]|nr:TolC family protein [Deltaproteobacteria bacterium]